MQLQFNHRDPRQQQPSSGAPLRFAASLTGFEDGRKERSAPGGGPESPAPGGGPATPKIDRPNVDELLKKMRKVDPDQSKRYRQRTGQ